MAAERRVRFEREPLTCAEQGAEGNLLLPNSYSGCSLAVFTSGGDSQGMNSAVRAVTRMGLYLGCRVYFIREGYQGMIDGDKYIEEADWNSVSDIIQRGGTILGSARCKDFMQRQGRMKACENLVNRGITNLVCIGGDGSLTGANMFRNEWPSYLEELVTEEKISADKAEECSGINIVGLVGSIDNDFCGTDMTIGTDTALHRIMEAVDAVFSTAQSHQRCFIIEVMGRHCGYLALVAALASEADWVFIPEWPPATNWPELLCERLSFSREHKQRVNIVIVAEGAVDQGGNAITSNQVRSIVTDQLKYDCRVTVLGHVQRGGNPSAYDRLLGCRMGAEAVVAVLEMTPESEPCVISIEGHQVVRVPLMECVQRTKEVQKAMDAGNYERAVHLRGPSFQRNLDMYKLLAKMYTPLHRRQALSSDSDEEQCQFNLAVVNVGAPACGMNAAVRSFVRIGLYRGCKVYGVEDSYDGLATGRFREMSWHEVAGWSSVGGSFLGTQKQLPNKLLIQIAEQLKKFKIHGLLLAGGFEAYEGALCFERNRDKIPEFCIPIVVIPCTISNNVPGTSYSLGSDTALNEICGIIDKIKQSATGTKKRVFIIETMGGYCGYLATLSALASGADNAYIFEEKFTIDDIKDDVKVIAKKMEIGVQRYLVIRNEKANDNYTTGFIHQLYCEEGHGVFTTRVNVLGHVQQGGCPSPFDRNQATKMAAKACDWLLQAAKVARTSDGGVFTNSSQTVTVLGIVDVRVAFTPLQDLVPMTDFAHRISNDTWWIKLRPLLRLLSKHSSTYGRKQSIFLSPKELAAFRNWSYG